MPRASNGYSRMREYAVWTSMKYRCTNPKSKSYRYYGGRGIKVCERWLESFENFLADMGKRPSCLYWIDRIDVNGNYESSNCKWVLASEQGSNRRPRRTREAA